MFEFCHAFFFFLSELAVLIINLEGTLWSLAWHSAGFSSSLRLGGQWEEWKASLRSTAQLDQGWEQNHLVCV